MTQTPQPKFAIRPEPPLVNSFDYRRWAKEYSLSYQGGSITSAYGNLIQTINFAGIPMACNSTTKNVSVGASSVVRRIGEPATSRKAYTYTATRFYKKNGSLAAGGEPIRVITDVGEYTARLTGSMEALATYICANRGQLYGDVTIYSPSGSRYSFTASLI